MWFTTMCTERYVLLFEHSDTCYYNLSTSLDITMYGMCSFIYFFSPISETTLILNKHKCTISFLHYTTCTINELEMSKVYHHAKLSCMITCEIPSYEKLYICIHIGSGTSTSGWSSFDRTTSWAANQILFLMTDTDNCKEFG